jgi:hypothetical protein
MLQTQNVDAVTLIVILVGNSNILILYVGVAQGIKKI